jgi:uncharacterized membrane protein YoaK (UPF0700 family)
MTGIVSSVADNLVLGNVVLVLSGLGALLSFLLGAASTAILINWARHRKMHSEYALSLALEALLLLVFGFLGANLNSFVVVFFPATVVVLCYIMGLQNAVVTKISHAEIRTTHVTGLVTDIGIELGKLFYWNKTHQKNTEHFVVADREKLTIHAIFLSMFFVGGVMGALGFKAFGFIAILPLAAALMFMALLPILDDISYFSHSTHGRDEH